MRMISAKNFFSELKRRNVIRTAGLYSRRRLASAKTNTMR
jgi:hypothetical protein